MSWNIQCEKLTVTGYNHFSLCVLKVLYSAPRRANKLFKGPVL
jgi:hypothetical protein